MAELNDLLGRRDKKASIGIRAAIGKAIDEIAESPNLAMVHDAPIPLLYTHVTCRDGDVSIPVRINLDNTAIPGTLLVLYCKTIEF